MSEPATLIPSPLQEHHERLGAKFAEFSGWSMPLEYAGVLAEHRAVREGVGVFDVSHLGKLLVTGPSAVAYLNTRLANDLGRIVCGKAQYTLLGTSDGGVADDLIAYIIDHDKVLLIPNAANAAAVAAQLGVGAPDDLRITDLHRDYAIIAVQGPDSARVLQAVGLPADMDYMGFAAVCHGGAETTCDDATTVCRTGYTGEHGYELVVPVAHAGEMWDELLAVDGVQPCGLGARDTLRTEMGYPLHGQDISPQISPVEAGLGWAIGWSKPVFDGADAMRELKEQGPARRLRGLKAVGRGIPRPGMDVLDADGAVIGTVTSGTFSPTLRRGIALALVDVAHQPGDQVGVRVRDHVEAFQLVKPPFVPARVR